MQRVIAPAILVILMLLAAVGGRLVSPAPATAAPAPVPQPDAAAPPLADVTDMGAGEYHTCAVTTDGVKCWGDNEFGQVGDGTAADRVSPVDVAGLTANLRVIDAGGSHTCAVTVNGAAQCWGANHHGQLGNGATDDPFDVVGVVGLESGVEAIAAGYRHTCALVDGGVTCWGQNDYGQLGDGSTTERTTPVAVAGLTAGVRAIAVGYYHSCALTDAGSVKCWGRNDWGALGDDSNTDRSTPVSVVGLSAGVAELAAGFNHTCARMNSGEVRCWGSNRYGELGDGTTTNRKTPVVVIDLADGVNAITAAYGHTCAVTKTNGAKCWGLNEFGELGDGTTTDRSIPVDVTGLTSGVTALQAGDHHTCAVAGGTMACWGYNVKGQLGNGIHVDKRTPVDVTGLTAGMEAVAAGYQHTCALTNEGGVKCWGANDYGALGDGTTARRRLPVDVSGLTAGVTAIAAGDDYTCALVDAGVKCWGANNHGQLGDDTFEDRTTPVDVVGLAEGVTALVAGKEHTCALIGGGVKCWGRRDFLGNDASADSATPVTVFQSGVTALAAGEAHTCVVVGAGVKCWGNNDDGQLGDGGTAAAQVPVDVLDLTGAITGLSAGYGHTCAIVDGGAKCWGRNTLGELGNGGTTSSGLPVAVTGLTSGVQQLVAAYKHTCAVVAGDAMLCWGANDYGELGDGTTIGRKTPVSVSGLDSDVTAMSGGYGHTCAVANDGVKCWGWNQVGQLGDGSAWTTTPGDVIDPSAPNVTPTPTRTATSTATPPQATATPTATSEPAVVDAYEDDDECNVAGTTAADAAAQTHTFHDAADVDWLRFNATAGRTYRIDVEIPVGSRADVVIELYRGCDQASIDRWNENFTPGARLQVEATEDETLLVRLSNVDATVAGGDVRYTVRITELADEPDHGALIIVAGRLRSGDPLQQNIHNVTDAVFSIYQAVGMPADRIRYLATDSTRPGWTDSATTANLEAAITDWAVDLVGDGRALTLYIIDHGIQDQLYLDGVSGQRLDTAQLDAWLDELQATVPDVKINVIIEACYSGSFIEGAESISGPGRVVITSANQLYPAWASLTGAEFSDQFFGRVRQGSNLYSSFWEARTSVQARWVQQDPWLDGDGDGIANEAEDFAVAADRGFSYVGTFADAWPPHIFAARLTGPIQDASGVIEADVRDDQGIDDVWAVIVPPSYAPPETSDELVPLEGEDLPAPIRLQAVGDGIYRATYAGFEEPGVYRVIIYADDNTGLQAQPVTVEVSTARKSFLPLIR